MFSHCQGKGYNASSENISVHAYSHPSSHTGAGSHQHVPPARNANCLTSFMQAWCGLDPSGGASASAGRKYSTTAEDFSSITDTRFNNLHNGDDCHISLSRFNKKVNGREVRYI